MDIARNIKALREHHNMSQSDLAKLLDVSDKAVSTWENGRREPRMGVIQKLALAFDLQISDIIEKDLETYYKRKTSPTPAAAEAREVNADQIIKAFVDAGIMPGGMDLTDEDLRFLKVVFRAIADWFAQRDKGAK